MRSPLQEMRRLHRRGELSEGKSLLFAETRPAEELYDTQADPWEMKNLAADPAHAQTLSRLRAAMDAWRREIKDMGEIPEVEMVRAWNPNLEQPVTATPIVIPDTDGNPGLDRVPAGVGEVVLRGPARLLLHTPTQGASIGYSFDEGDDPKWELYTAPITPPVGRRVLRAKAIRIGYKESPVTKLAVVSRPG